ncbi:FAD-binding oxidoreductase [Micromonospora sp. WMMD737]|uniref:FAD-binding oxidoreductase n=1 Tax=Micromonospora sp. WMMD737 TaxID=3404113 RepID=UPI003B93C0C1
MADLEASLALPLAAHASAGDIFWTSMHEHGVRCLPQHRALILFSTLEQLIAGRGDPAGRRAALAVLGRMYRRFGFSPHHGTLAAAAMADTVRRLTGASWNPELTCAWELGCRRAMRLAERAAEAMGDGPGVTVGEAEAVELVSEGVAVLTIRPMQRLSYLAGQAMPVCTPRLPGQWRWFSPANAPRPDGRVEFHIRAVAGGDVSSVLVNEVEAGEVLWLGPAVDVGLSLEAAGDADLLLAAGGTGLAPLRALVEWVAASPFKRRVTLVVGARTLDGLYDAVALDKLQMAHGDWLTLVVALSADLDVEPVVQGDLLSIALDHYRPGQAFYVCGPPRLIEAARSRLPAAGVDPGCLHLAATFERGSCSPLSMSRPHGKLESVPGGAA